MNAEPGRTRAAEAGGRLVVRNLNADLTVKTNFHGSEKTQITIFQTRVYPFFSAFIGVPFFSYKFRKINSVIIVYQCLTCAWFVTPWRWVSRPSLHAKLQRCNRRPCLGIVIVINNRRRRLRVYSVTRAEFEIEVCPARF